MAGVCINDNFDNDFLSQINKATKQNIRFFLNNSEIDLNTIKAYHTKLLDWSFCETVL